ncbi:MAG: 3'-5' exonuclease [Flavobacteriales bacterium]|nr:putative bifunctional exonuclease/endonuclease protein [Flavobacteriales bacterium]MCC6578573.1 3'-5' exonuclease [Flavobacteriales bacterium]NUQ15825.1 3'-5' exonuclease [Flavobacteriales bacterium]
MDRAQYAVVDVETTMGDPTRGRIMEMALVLVNEDGPVAWSALVDPGVPVPPFARMLTGLSARALRHAPRFHRLVPRLLLLTEGRVMVAHNARYDMAALSAECARAGVTFERPALCTERLSRQLVPQLTHHNLGEMCRYFGIPFTGRHRALNDARATAALLERLIDGFGVERVSMAVNHPVRAARA